MTTRGHRIGYTECAFWLDYRTHMLRGAKRWRFAELFRVEHRHSKVCEIYSQLDRTLESFYSKVGRLRGKVTVTVNFPLSANVRLQMSIARLRDNGNEVDIEFKVSLKASPNR
jgi:hypothetical protein